MDLREIIESGLLELYVLNRLSEEEMLQVQRYIQKYPELTQEITEIERGFFALGRSMEVTVPPHVKDNLLKKIRESNGTVSSGSSWTPMVVSVLLLLSTLAFFYLWNQEKGEVESLQSDMADAKSECDSITTAQSDQLALYEQLYDPNNKILAFQATENYPQTNLYFHNNPQTNRNFIQVQGLPDLASDQSFQLWSLKGDDAPRPLDVFEGEDQLFEVEFVEGSNAYAITIEQRGGAQTPNLEQLIGIVEISS